jgi:hypothetical protein
MSDAAGRQYEPLLLYGRRAGATTISGVALLHYGDERSAVQRDLLDAIGTVLLPSDSIVS